MEAVGPRLKERLADLGMSQSELARRVGLNQSSIAALVAGRSRSSAHLHKIARELGTSPAYLTGETSDPDIDAPPPPPVSRVQHLTLSVALPSEQVLEAAFRGLLMASRELDEAELARELAKRLPTLLRVSEGAYVAPSTGTAVDREAAADRADDHGQRRRA